MPTDTEQTTEKQVQQRVHADLYNVPDRKLEELQKQEPSNGRLCTICKVKGCRIGPMGRG